MLLPQSLLTLVLLAVCSFAPGFLFVRRLRWSGMEKLCGSVALCEKFLAMGEAYRRGDPEVEPAKQELRAATAEQLKKDDTFWHGWYRRNGGEFELIGDHFGGGDATSVLLALAALGLLWRMAQQAPTLTAAAAAKPKSSRSRHKR